MCQWVSKSGRPLVILGVEYGEGETFSQPLQSTAAQSVCKQPPPQISREELEFTLDCVIDGEF